MEKSKRNQRGVISVLVMLMLIPTFALTGLVADVGWYYYTRNAARAAAEAGALAAVRSAMVFVNANPSASYSCSSLGCQGATGCPETATNLEAACQYATANGFSNSGKQTVTVEANVGNPTSYASGVQALYYASVSIVQQNPLTFLAVLGGSSVNVGVRATAAIVDTVPNFCVAALDPSASGAITAGGNARNITLTNCSMGVDSSSTTAFSTNGNGCVTAVSVQVHGGASSVGGSCTQPTTGVPSFADPLYGLGTPTQPSGGCQSPTSVNGVPTYSPGNICGGISGTASFLPGVYYVLGGGMTCHGNCTLSGTGVTFYMTCSSSPCNGSSAATIDFNANSTENLSAPTTGPLAGILFFEDRTSSAGSDKINGGANTTLNGTVYLSKDAVSFIGNAATTNTILIADTVSFSGNSSASFQVASGSNAIPSQPTPLLVQ
ncbi:MAG: hypothetical protein JO033_28470 [Acidobacteriaceae bacterium]|nr:hypothetical protein [Acidobacteriaceae bacterium]MBV9498107.1 hypothetical protein [Acidobacteriaceae bacterium]